MVSPYFLFLNYIMEGLVLGAIYVLMALGLNLIFGVMRIVNFAHGELYMLGAFLYLVIYKICGSPIISLFSSMAIVGVVGVAIQFLGIRPILKTKEWENNSLLFTFGLSVFFQNLALVIWGAQFVGAPAILPGSSSIGGIILSNQRIVTIVFSIFLAITMYVYLNKTLFGKAIRAVSQNPMKSSLVGINNSNVYLAVFGIGAALAAVAGALGGPMFLIYPKMGVMPVLKAFVVVIFGGMGSASGSIFAGLLLGIIESLASVYISSQYRDVISYTIMVAVLIFRPSGLLGRK